jgi:hypothetical protein
MPSAHSEEWDPLVGVLLIRGQGETCGDKWVPPASLVVQRMPPQDSLSLNCGTRFIAPQPQWPQPPPPKCALQPRPPTRSPRLGLGAYITYTAARLDHWLELWEISWHLGRKKGIVGGIGGVRRRLLRCTPPTGTWGWVRKLQFVAESRWEDDLGTANLSSSLRVHRVPSVRQDPARAIVSISPKSSVSCSRRVFRFF